MASFRSKRRTRRLLLLVSMTATAVAFLAPAAQAAPTVITVSKTASPAEDGSVAAGGTITYTVTMTNGAGDVATGLSLTDGTPANTQYVADSANVNGVPVLGATNPFEDGEAVPDIPVSGVATASFQVTVDSPLADGTPLSNTATLSAANADPSSVLSDSANHTVAAAPALSVTKTSVPAEGGTVNPGDTVDYTVVVENLASGSDTTSGLTVTDPTPANTTFVDGSATVDGGAPIAGGNPFATPYSLSDLAPGQSHTVTFQVQVNDPPLPNGAPVDNTASAEATNNPPVTDDANLTVTSAPGLTVDKTASPAEGGPVVPGDTVTYSIVVSNDPTATDTATGVVLTDVTPTNTTYVADSATLDSVPVPGTTNPFEAGAPLPPMAPGDSHTATFAVTVNNPLDNGTQIVNTATVSSDQLPDATDDATHTVQSAPVLTMAKTSAPAETGKVTPGTVVTYSVVMTNDAAATEVAKNVTLLDPTPENMVYVDDTARLNGTSVASSSSSKGGSANPLANPFPLPDIPPGESQTVTFDMKVVQPLANGTVVSNVAKMTADNHPDLQDAATHTVDSVAVLKVATDSLPDEGSKVKGGQTIVFDLLVQNDAAATDSLRNVVVTAGAPTGTTFVSGSVKVDGVAPSPSGSGSTGLSAPSSNALASGYLLGSMNPGTSHSVSFKAKVKDTAGSITATWTVTAEGLQATTATTTLRGPNSGAGSDGDGDGDGSGTGGTDDTSGTGGAVSASDDELAFTGLDLAKLLLLATTLLLAGWTLMARGKALQRRGARATVQSESYRRDTPGFPRWDRWAGAWFYPDSRK